MFNNKFLSCLYKSSFIAAVVEGFALYTHMRTDETVNTHADGEYRERPYLLLEK